MREGRFLRFFNWKTWLHNERATTDSPPPLLYPLAAMQPFDAKRTLATAAYGGTFIGRTGGVAVVGGELKWVQFQGFKVGRGRAAKRQKSAWTG